MTRNPRRRLIRSIIGVAAASNTRTAVQPLAQASIQWVDRGPNTGQIQVKVKSLTGAVSYELRYAVAPAGGGAPTTWTSQMLAGTKTVTVSNLAPATTYAFQVRALGRLGYSDWSDTVTFICAYHVGEGSAGVKPAATNPHATSAPVAACFMPAFPACGNERTL